MDVTLVTDASYCGMTKIAAAAAWANSGRGRFFGSALVMAGGNNSAEMHAVAYGLRKALDAGVFMPGDRIALQTDSHYAWTRLAPDYKPLRREQREAINGDTTPPRVAIKLMLENNALTLEVVRSSEGPVLHWVDQKARALMLEERVARLVAEMP